MRRGGGEDAEKRKGVERRGEEKEEKERRGVDSCRDDDVWIDPKRRRRGGVRLDHGCREETGLWMFG